MQFEYFEMEEIVTFHSKMIKKYKGLRGLREMGLLVSVVNNPKMTFDGKQLYPDVFAKSACYLYGIVKNHPFIDGNKRTGSFVAYLFLRKHGVIPPPLDLYEELVVKVADGKVSMEEVAEFFRSFNQKSEGSYEHLGK